MLFFRGVTGWGVGALLLLLTACDPVRHVADTQSLLAAKPRIYGNRSVDSDILAEGVRSKPNRRVLLPRFYLGLWNLGEDLVQDSSAMGRLLGRLLDKKGEKTASLIDLLKRNGEPPALVDHELLRLDCGNLERIYFGKGYLRARVGYEVTYRKLFPHQGWVTFFVREGPPYVLRSIRYLSEKDTLVQIVNDHAAEKLLQPGQLYSEEKISAERSRVAELMRNHGFFRFDASQITFLVDTLGTWDPDSLQQAMGKDAYKRMRQLKQHTIARVVDVEVDLPDSAEIYAFGDVLLSFQRANSGLLPDSAFLYFDTQSLTRDLRRDLGIPPRRLNTGDPHTFRVEPGMAPWLNYTIISRRVKPRPGLEYAQRLTRDSYRELQNLGIFRAITLRNQVNDSARKVNLAYDMPLLPRFSFNVGLETFQSEDRRLNSNLPGVGGKVNLLRRNAFKRAEQLGLEVTGNVSFYQPVGRDIVSLFFQIQGRLYLNVPRLLGLDKYAERLKLYNPQTNFNFTYSQENRQDFNRQTAAAEFRYQFLHNSPTSRVQSQLTPLSLNVVNSSLRQEFFRSLIGRNPFTPEGQLDSSLTTRERQLIFFVSRDFQPRLNDKFTYYFVFNNRYGTDRKKPSFFVRVGGELGGTLAYALDGISNLFTLGDGSTQDGVLFKGLKYGQFFRVTLEAKAFFPLGERNDLVFRALVGGGTGFNRNVSLLLENRFYTGGISSIRGWASNLLGPGTVPTRDLGNLPIGGEYILELNAELRTRLFGPLGTAVFLDAGNVWFGSTGSNDLGDKRAELSLQTFKLGFSGGIGVRLDFSFLLVRLDLAQQFYAPDIQRWVIRQFPRDVGGSRFQFNIGIGMPF